jgi:predicted Zn-dependent protease
MEPALAAQQTAPAEPPAAEPAPPAAIAPAPSDETALAADSARVASWWLQTARRKLASDDSVGAEAAARKVLASDPQSLPATEILARALVDQERGKDALPFARKLVQRAGKRVPYRLLLGDVLLMTGDEAAARREWERALEIAPYDAEIQRRLGPAQ